MENNFSDADALYDKWEQEWKEMIRTDEVDEGKAYYEQNLWKDKIIEGAREEYDNITGGEADGREVYEQTTDVP